MKMILVVILSLLSLSELRAGEFFVTISSMEVPENFVIDRGVIDITSDGGDKYCFKDEKAPNPAPRKCASFNEKDVRIKVTYKQNKEDAFIEMSPIRGKIDNIAANKHKENVKEDHYYRLVVDGYKPRDMKSKGSISYSLIDEELIDQGDMNAELINDLGNPDYAVIAGLHLSKMPEIKDKKLALALVKNLGSEDKAIRTYASLKLLDMRIRDKDVLLALVGILNNDRYEVYSNAESILKRNAVENKEVILALIESIKNENYGTYHAAIEILKNSKIHNQADLSDFTDRLVRLKSEVTGLKSEFIDRLIAQWQSRK